MELRLNDKQSIRSIEKNGHMYLHADDLALVLDERGEEGYKADFGGFNGRVIKQTFGMISRFIREVARNQSVEESVENGRN